MRNKKTSVWLFISGFAPFMLTIVLQMMAVYAGAAMGWKDIGTGSLILFEGMVWGIYGVWYYRKYVKTKNRDFRSGISSIKTAPHLFVILAIGLQYITELWNVVARAAFPDAVKAYQELMETSGMTGEISLAVGFYTVIMAPVGEELIFRGVTLRTFEKAGCGFWTANILQSLLFGAFHYNFIQGVYAFVIGIVIGYVVNLYGTLYAGIVLHIIFNLIGSYLYQYLPAREGAVANVISLTGTVIAVMTLVYMKKRIRLKETGF